MPAAPSASEVRTCTYGVIAESHFDKIDHDQQLAAEIDLNTTRDIDDLLAGLDPAHWHPQARREILVNYLGFPFWDVLTFPITSARELGELNEILVDRISPQDARALKGFAGIDSLKGVGFAHFAAFLSRAYRENDYLLGRLHAVDRLIDIVCDSAGPDCIGKIDVTALKRRAFTLVLDSEEKHSPSRELIEALRRAWLSSGLQPRNEPDRILASIALRPPTAWLARSPTFSVTVARISVPNMTWDTAHI